MNLRTIVLVFSITSSVHSQVSGNRVLGLIHYAEDVCTQVKASTEIEQEFELCKYKFLGILTTDENLVEIEQMAFILGYIFGESMYNNGLDLAKQIHNKCKGICGVKGQLASKQGEPFFECVSKIIKINFNGEMDTPKVKLLARVTSDIELQPGEQIYPNLTCHEGYNSDSSVPGDGEAYLVDMYKFCKYTRDPAQKNKPECLKICMAEYLGLIDTTVYGNTRVQWNRYGDMVNYLRQLIVAHNTINGKALANKILAACREKIKLVETHRTNPCHTTYWRDFFQCVDPIWDCQVR